jgi:secernin
MCDTLYAGRSVSSEGRAWFAKNSDRDPAEPQTLCLVPRGSAGSLSFALSRPVWMKGGEMGVNEAGVAIGNEAVFSRFGASKKGVLGMDILRMALASARSAAAARDFIACFVETHDQGGNGAYKGSLVYSNSFIVAGPDEAFVLETAGRRWAWKSIASFAAISNAYSLDDCEGADRATASEGQASWRARVEDRFYLAFTRGDSRRSRNAQRLAAASPAISFSTLLAALRDHGDGRPGRAGMSAPCLHEAGFPLRSSTTASLVFEYLPSGPGPEGILWFTGSPHPCLSVFAPVLLAGGEFLPLWTGYDYDEASPPSEAGWKAARARGRALGGAGRSADPSFVAARDAIQERLRAAALEARGDLASARKAVDAAMADWAALR